MKILLLVLCFLLHHHAFAEKIISSVYSIDRVTTDGAFLIFFENGRASFVSSEKTNLLTMIKKSEINQHLLRITINKKNQVIDAKEMRRNKLSSDKEWAINNSNFEPSVLKGPKGALKVFRKMRGDYTKSGECYNRAHIWSYEEFKKTGLNSMKIFMFFTSSYIKKYNYKWWFHVTPALYVGTPSTLKTFDRRYTKAPRDTKTWSDTFIKSKRECKVVTKFDDYWLNQESEDCYHIYSSMYYLIPRDLEKRDITGTEKTEFVKKEVIRAYKNGFGKIVKG